MHFKRGINSKGNRKEPQSDHKTGRVVGRHKTWLYTKKLENPNLACLSLKKKIKCQLIIL